MRSYHWPPALLVFSVVVLGVGALFTMREIVGEEKKPPVVCPSSPQYSVLASKIIARVAASERVVTEGIKDKFNAKTNVRLIDGTIADMMNERFVYEVDWADNWYEGVGQALHYAEVSDHRPALVLLVRDPQREWRHLVRAAWLCGKLGVAFYVEPVP